GQTGDYVAYLEPDSGEFTRFDLPDGAGPHNVIVGEFVWYSGNRAANIGRLSQDGDDLELFPMPESGARDPHTLVFDSQGTIWFTVQNGNYVGRLEPSSGDVRLARVPTSRAGPYGIIVDRDDRPWFTEFGTNKIASIDRETFEIEEFVLPRSGARPRRIGATSDGLIWYVDYAQGRLGRFDPATEEFREWLLPGGTGARPYGMAVDHRDRIWLVETGSFNRFVGFQPATEEFFSNVPIPSGGGVVRHMQFDLATRSVWFGTDAGTIGRARVE
ncbi:MAG TPA: lyase, partial [Planctomycetota bacterium]|nr:lyase [Planctomycetota bacterium]